jgi:toxin-antitoxin system PIN domain toxin
VSVALDANILLYAVNADDARNERAVQVLADLVDGPEVVYLFWPVVMAFLRISTRAGIFPRPLSAMEALTKVGALLEHDHFYAPGENERFWSVFWEVATEERVTGDLVTHAHIVALMRSYGVRTVITHDRDFRRFDGIRMQDPFA